MRLEFSAKNQNRKDISQIRNSPTVAVLFSNADNRAHWIEAGRVPLRSRFRPEIVRPRFPHGFGYHQDPLGASIRKITNCKSRSLFRYSSRNPSAWDPKTIHEDDLRGPMGFSRVASKRTGYGAFDFISLNLCRLKVESPQIRSHAMDARRF